MLAGLTRLVASLLAGRIGRTRLTGERASESGRRKHDWRDGGDGKVRLVKGGRKGAAGG